MIIVTFVVTRESIFHNAVVTVATDSRTDA